MTPSSWRPCRTSTRVARGSGRGSSSSSAGRRCALAVFLCLVAAVAATVAVASSGEALSDVVGDAAIVPEASAASAAVLDGSSEETAPAAPAEAQAPKAADMKNNGSTSTSHRKDDEILDVTVNPDGSTTTTVRLAPNRVQRSFDDEEVGDSSDDEEYDSQEDDDESEVKHDGPDFYECTRNLVDGTERSLDDIKRCYGVEQSTNEYDQSILQEVDAYMRTVVAIESKFESVRPHCRNTDRLCTYWATIGECQDNPAFMLTNCGPACRSCDKFIYEERCPTDPNMHETNAWKPGDLNRFFERVVTHPHYQQYQPTVLCRPGMFNEHAQRDCPWVVTLDNFLTDHECDALIQQGSVEGYERSEDVGERNPDGSYGSVQSSGRTSTNAWCSDNCLANATVQGVIAKLENLTGISDANNEFLQLLRYEVGQFYEAHHDYIDHDVDRASGPRILTVFLYLNDVDEGGATHFTNLDLAVHPKRGRVLLWPSVLDEDPSAVDLRTHHQAQKVVKGIKFGANSWVHLRDFKTPYAAGCT